ncbi:LytR C-terminal domain-containing protein [Kitasatospora sp. NPDC002040]|uniref:LytR C-terminal domain-containing protein n=1 Tax=Kitasatospora sp. NPDC002040 TaxID=3154661 RepID=UPI00332FDF4A
MTGPEERGNQEWYPQEPYQEYQPPQPQQQVQYDAYGQPQQYVQDPYQQQYYQPQQPQPEVYYDAYGQPQQYVQDPYRQQPQQEYRPPAPPAPPVAPVLPVQPVRPPAEPPAAAAPPAPRRPAAPAAPAADYPTGEFTFVDEEAEQTEDVIDWLKFAESRSERRDERRRRLRNRLVGGLLALVLVAGGTAGYLWWQGRGGDGAAAQAAGGRTVNVVHLRDLQGKVSSALLVNDQSGQKASVLLLPDTLKLPGSGITATEQLGKSLDAAGASGTREGLTTVLGAPIGGTWRLDTPYLRLLVAQLGGIKVDTNAVVREGNLPGGKELAPVGKDVTLSAVAAVAYATYQAPGESTDAQLARFGQVLTGVLKVMPTDLKEAQDVVHRVGAVPDPSLPEAALAGVLVQLAQLTKGGHLATSALTVQPDGTLDDATAGKQVKDVLGGTVKNAQSVAGRSTRVTLQNAVGNDDVAATATALVTNSGLELLPGIGKVAVQPLSEIRYTDDAKLPTAQQLALTLGLKDTAVKKVTAAQNADLVVVLGKDYQPPKAQ